MLGTAADDLADALAALADRLAKPIAAQAKSMQPTLPVGPLTTRTMAEVVGALLPEGAIIADEANTSGVFLADATKNAPPHGWLTLTGSAIGQGLPVATGAAVACPDRPVVCLESDGSAMYTLQALWTQARERLNVTTILLNNHFYAIVGVEMQRFRAGPVGERSA